MQQQQQTEKVIAGLALVTTAQNIVKRGGFTTCSRKLWAANRRLFICVWADEEMGLWVPTFTNPGPHRILVPSNRTGHPTWINSTYHAHPEQVWRVSHEGMLKAAKKAGDMSTPEMRNYLHEATAFFDAICPHFESPTGRTKPQGEDAIVGKWAPVRPC